MKLADSKKLPLHNYEGKLKTAVSWLGNRYLLAEPVRRREREGEFKGYYFEPRRWHEAAREHAGCQMAGAS